MHAVFVVEVVVEGAMARGEGTSKRMAERAAAAALAEMCEIRAKSVRSREVRRHRGGLRSHRGVSSRARRDATSSSVRAFRLAAHTASRIVFLFFFLPRLRIERLTAATDPRRHTTAHESSSRTGEGTSSPS